MSKATNRATTENICYWCGKPATTREHVPPRCFFPDRFECDGKTITANWERLITVPACPQHNNSKSSLDDYLRMHIVPFAKPENRYAASLNKGKILRAWRRSHHLLKIKSFDGDVIVFDADDQRLGYAVDSITRALFFHEFKSCFEGTCYVHIGHYSAGSAQYGPNTEAISAIMRERSQWNTKVKGEYPEVFQYQFSPTDEWGVTSLILTFYETINVVVVLADNAHRMARSQLDPIALARACNIDPRPFYLSPQGYCSTDEKSK